MKEIVDLFTFTLALHTTLSGIGTSAQLNDNNYIANDVFMVSVTSSPSSFKRLHENMFWGPNQTI